MDINKTKLRDIRKSVKSAGGEYEKLNMTVNGEDVYKVNGKRLTKSDMIYAYLTNQL